MPSSLSAAALLAVALRITGRPGVLDLHFHVAHPVSLPCGEKAEDLGHDALSLIGALKDDQLLWFGSLLVLCANPGARFLDQNPAAGPFHGPTNSLRARRAFFDRVRRPHGMGYRVSCRLTGSFVSSFHIQRPRIPMARSLPSAP